MNTTVLLQYGINKKTEDLEELYIRTLLSATPYERAFKQTTFLKNRAYVSYFKQGFVICNNKPLDGEQDEDRRNIIKTIFDEERPETDDEDEQFPGALVANPTYNSNTGVVIFGKNSAYVYDFVTDEDFSAMYPSITIVFNISGATLIGKLILDIPIDKIKHFYEVSDKDIKQWDAGREFIENYICNNPTMVGNIWFNLPTGEELIDKFTKRGNI